MAAADRAAALRAVENGMHNVRDVALGEDAYRVPKGASPRVLAAFANLRRAMHPFRLGPREALAVLLGAKPLRAH